MRAALDERSPLFARATAIVDRSERTIESAGVGPLTAATVAISDEDWSLSDVKDGLEGVVSCVSRCRDGRRSWGAFATRRCG